jgi:hypothetical protein
LYARLLRHIQHLDTASASVSLLLYQLLRQNLYFCTSKASTLRIYLARGRLDALQRRGACQYLYFCTSKCASICTFVLVNQGTVEQLTFISMRRCSCAGSPPLHMPRKLSCKRSGGERSTLRERVLSIRQHS